MAIKRTLSSSIFLLSLAVTVVASSLIARASARILPRSTWPLQPLDNDYVGSIEWPRDYTYTLTLVASANATAYFYLRENITDIILWN
nr:hypothetical protein [Candidatus Sigynarchaeota archaeon]